jgi:hypothetical protein
MIENMHLIIYETKVPIEIQKTKFKKMSGMLHFSRWFPPLEPFQNFIDSIFTEKLGVENHLKPNNQKLQYI